MNGRTGISWSQLRVGAAVAVAVAILAVSIFFIGETGEVFGQRYQLTTLMPSANGLVEGAGVRLAGQDVGKVDRIEFVPVEERARGDHVLRLTLGIDRSVSEQIRADSEARVRTQGLLGDKIIDITPGSPEAPVLERGDTIRSAAAIDYEQMLSSFSVIIDDLAATLSDVRSLADTILAGHGTAGLLLTDTALYVEFLRTTRTMNRFLDAVARGEGALARLTRDPELYGDLRSAILGLDSLTWSLLNGEGTFSRLLTDETLYVELSTMSTRADSVLATLESGEGTLGQMVNDQALYENLLKLVVDMQKIVQELRESPRKYIPPIKVF